MSEDTDVMFRIGVMDHPASKTALQELASAVEAAQARMTAGVESIGQTAARVGGMVDSLTGNLDRLRSSVSQADAGVESVRYASTGVRGPDYVPSAPASQPAQQTAPKPTGNNDQLSRSMKNVFAELGTEHLDQMDAIVEAIESKIAELPSAVQSQTEALRSAYAAQMVEHSETYAAMAQDLDGYLAKNGSTVEQIAANLRRGEASIAKYRESASLQTQESNKMFVESALHVAQMAKGLATIGLVSEENAQKFMQSLAVIQGTFDILKGGIEAYEKFGKGIKAAREAKDLLTKASTVASAVETAQLAQARAYHAALVQEAVAANAAAGANSRLAASRAAAGASGAAAAAGSVASGVGDAVGDAVGSGLLGRFKGLGRFARAGRAASGAAAAAGSGVGSAVGSGAGAVAAGGGMLKGLGGLAGGAGAATLGAGAAAAGGLYLAGRAVYESVSGKATQSDSSIAALESRMAAWTLRLTGLFESTDAPMVKFAQSLSGYADKILSYVPGGDTLKNLNVLGDIAGLAASQAAVERGQASLAKNRIVNEGNREQERATAMAEAEKGRINFGNNADMLRRRAQAETQSFGFRDLAGDREAERTNMFNRHKLRGVTDEGVLGAATVNEISGNAARMRARPSESDTQLKAETQVYASAVSQYAKAKADLDETLSFAGSTEEERTQKLKEATFYHDEMLKSLDRQAQLSRASGEERLQIEREIQSVTLSAIDQQQAKLDALNERRKSAMKSFVDMDAVERDMATKALAKARMQGGAALSKTEADLLGRVGTDETNRFVDQATEAQAKKLGFENTFGTGIEATRKQIEGTRQQLEAQLQASFDVSMKVEADTDAVVNAIYPQVDTAIKDMTKSIMQDIDSKLEQTKATIRTEVTQKTNQLKRN